MEPIKPKYKTWIRKKAIVLFSVLSFIFLFGIASFQLSIWFLLFTIPAIVSMYILIIISLSAYRFSPKGGDFQNKIHELIVSNIEKIEPNHILDIGCGSGHLIIKCAKSFPNSNLIGVDYWGKNWEYSKKQSERNAELEKINSRLEFMQCSASKLKLKENFFDTVISCLTFHEVNDTEDKLNCISEAIRVLKPKGKFIFFDLFLNPKFYPTIAEIRKYIELEGAQLIETKKISEYLNLPFPLKNKKVLGHGMMIIGKKNS